VPFVQTPPASLDVQKPPETAKALGNQASTMALAFTLIPIEEPAGNFFPLSINSRGLVTGALLRKAGQELPAGDRPPLWDAVRQIRLEKEPGCLAQGFAVTEQGRVCGVFGTLYLPYDLRRFLTGFPLEVLLGVSSEAACWQGERRFIQGLFGSAIVSVNRSSSMVGWVLPGPSFRAAEWGPKGSYRLLKMPNGCLSSAALAVSDTGTIVGAASRSEKGLTQPRAVLWRSGEPIELQPLDGAASSLALAVSETDRIAGVCWIDRRGLDIPQAVIWEKGRCMAIAGADHPSIARAANRQGWVVGSYRRGKDWRAFLWTGRRFCDLATETANATGLNPFMATGINDEGWIVGIMGAVGAGTETEERKGFVLKPSEGFNAAIK
jgi:hypothetical protein